MKRSLIFFFLILPFLTRAQDEGVQFVKALNWGQVLQKAKAKHKPIFVDCYATWCGPCKQMDAEVYPQKDVGDAYNQAFLSVRLQMDQTKDDNEQVRTWYSTAKSFQQSYAITAFPTFLFFDENGRPIHKVTAAMSPGEFIKLASDALNPEKQYYHILNNFKAGKLDTAEEKGLARSFLYTDKILAGKLAADYLNRVPKEQLNSRYDRSLMIQLQQDPAVLSIALTYITDNRVVNTLDLLAGLDKQPRAHGMAMDYLKSLDTRLNEKKNLLFMEQLNKDTDIQTIAKAHIEQMGTNKLLDPDQIQFAAVFTDMSSGKGFELFYRHQTEVDTVMHSKGYARGIIDAIIDREEVRPKVSAAKKSGTDPDWVQMERYITQRYGAEYVKPAILYGEYGWYQYKKDWKNYTKYLTELMDMMLSDLVKKKSLLTLNNGAWQIFTYSDNPEELLAATKWSDQAIQLDTSPNGKANGMDTKANLLYRAGKKQEAIALEAEAAKLDPKNKDIAANYEKMLQGAPTWSLNN